MASPLLFFNSIHSNPVDKAYVDHAGDVGVELMICFTLISKRGLRIMGAPPVLYAQGGYRTRTFVDIEFFWKRYDIATEFVHIDIQLL